MSHPPSAVPASARRGVLVAIAAVALSACATAGPKQAALQWPFPPEKPRVRYVRSFAKADDLKAGALTNMLRVFVPASPDAVVTQPTGLALSPDERFLYVACTTKVLRVELAAGKMDVIANVEGKRPGRPLGVAVDGGGNLYVSDAGQGAVWVYAPDGAFLRRFGAEKLDKPTGIAIDRRRQLVYVVSGVAQASTDHRVEVFSQAGEHLRTIGTRGAAPGQFNFPTNLAVAPDGNLYVVDMLNFRVQVFDPEGQLVTLFGSIGAGMPGTFNKAKSVGFDAFANVYVVDSEQGFVQIFNPRFQPLMAFGGRAKAVGYMLVPTAIAITSGNTIYVSDYAAGMVNEYQLINTAAEDGVAPPPTTAEASGRSPG
jgi:DNA-binding beta-propeller fold protein YncE